MQIKKFEAKTIQDALDAIKRELGPEAVILQTKQNRKGFGLLSKTSVEVTAAVSERSLGKKKAIDSRLPEKPKEQLQKLPAARQAKIYDQYSSRKLDARAASTQDQVNLGVAKTAHKMTTRRYADISDDATDVQTGAQLSSQLSSKTQPKGKLTAALKDAFGGIPGYGQAEGINRAARGQASSPADLKDVEGELKILKDLVLEMKSKSDQKGGSGAQSLVPDSVFSTPALQSAFESLVINGVDKRYALDLIKKVKFSLNDDRCHDMDFVSDQLAGEIMQSVDVISALEGMAGVPSAPVVLAIVGPTGVGKTTTIAKIASEAILKRKLKVGLINVDCYKVSAVDHLSTYAKILNVPFRSVADRQQLDIAIKDLGKLDLVLIDTTGRSQKDQDSLAETKELLQGIPNLRVELMLSATTRDTELYDMGKRFSVFRPEGLIVSKLDEALTYGGIYNVCHRLKLPLIYFTTGQRVPEDIEEATPERLASLILEI